MNVRRRGRGSGGAAGGAAGDSGGAKRMTRVRISAYQAAALSPSSVVIVRVSTSVIESNALW